MPFVSLAQAARRLGIDAKTLRRWLAQAQLHPQPHPSDARITGITSEQLCLLATTHHRSLPALPGEFPAPAPTGPAPEPYPLPPELLELLQQLRAVPAELAAVQQQLAELTQRLQQPPQAPAVPVSSCHDAAARVNNVGQRRAAPTAGRSHVSAASSSKRSPAHVLPLVEYVHVGHYVVICPKQGLLPLQPETPEWFAWLGTHTSFRFVGKAGRLTAHRELQCVSRAVWRAHRQIRNHTYNLRLGKTQDVTIAALEQAAAALQAHLK